MKRVDVVLAGVLVLAVVASVVGSARYEDTRVGTFAVAWSTRSVEVEPVSLAHGGAGDARLDLAVDERNLSALDVLVRVRAEGPRATPTEVRVEATSPDGRTETTETTLAPGLDVLAELRLPFLLAPTPDVREVRAASPQAARATLAAEHGSDAGVGVWTVVVRFAPGATGALAGETYAVDVRAAGSAYEADVRPPTPEVPR